MDKGRLLLAGTYSGCAQPADHRDLDIKRLTGAGWVDDSDGWYRGWDTFGLDSMTNIMQCKPSDFMDSYQGYEVSDLQGCCSASQCSPELIVVLVLARRLDGSR